MGSNLHMRHAPIATCALVLSVFPRAQADLTDPDAYAVYNAIIPSNWLLRVAHAKELFIQETTRVINPNGQQCVPEGPDLIGPWAAALANSQQENASAKTLVRQFTLPVPYRLVAKETLDGFFNTAGIYGWDAFHATYPDARGFLRVSAVGFDEGHEHAIVWVGHSCGGLCAESGFHFLQRTTTSWSEARLRVNS